MTTIAFDGFQMAAKGHAGFAEQGKDIVCAGMSTLFAAAAEMILDLEANRMLDLSPVIRLCPGDVLLAADPLPEGQERTKAIFDYLAIGCRILAESYPENVCIYSACG